MFVPVVGWLVVLGYEMEWARLVAWGFEGPPPKSDIDISECLRSGWRAFVAVAGCCVVWMTLYYIVAMAVTRAHFESYTDLFDVWNLIVTLPWALLSAWNPAFWIPIIAISFCVVLTVMVGVRATIYQDSAAGYQVKRIVEMIRRDACGYVKLSGMGALVVLACDLILLMLAQAMVVMSAFTMLAGGIFFILLLHPLIFLLLTVYCTVVFLMIHTMVGLWMRQFDVSSWSASEDSLPVGWQPGPSRWRGSTNGWDWHATQSRQLEQSPYEGQSQQGWSQVQDIPPTASASVAHSSDTGLVLPMPATPSQAARSRVLSPRSRGELGTSPLLGPSARLDRPSPVSPIDPISLAIEALASQPPQPTGDLGSSQPSQSADPQASPGPQAKDVLPSQD